MENESYKNLITLLKLFKNRPYHLAKYLIDNKAFNQIFFENLSKSVSLNKFSKDENIGKNNPEPIHFINISQMESFYASLIDDKDLVKKTKQELEIELNNKLNNLISEEKYEEAAYIRDLMKLKKVKRKPNN